MKLLTLARDLRRRKARERQGFFVAEGIRTVEELLRSPIVIHGALVAPSLATTARGSALAAALVARRTELGEVTEEEFATAADTESPQGVLAIGVIPARSLEELRLPAVARILLLDGIQDPGNVGTIVRTAAALGASATLALPGTVDLWNAKVVRSSMGALFHHPAAFSDPKGCSEFLGREAVTLWAADAGGETLGARQPPSRLAIALGNEGHGLSDFVTRLASRKVAVPITGGIESLNVAVTAGILLHELRP